MTTKPTELSEGAEVLIAAGLPHELAVLLDDYTMARVETALWNVAKHQGSNGIRMVRPRMTALVKAILACYEAGLRASQAAIAQDRAARAQALPVPLSCRDSHEASLKYVEGWEAAKADSAARAQAEPAKLRDPRMEPFDREGPLPGMIAAFEMQFGQSWTDKDWRDEAATWAMAWKASLAARAQGAGEAVANSQDAEMLHGAHEVIRIWNERARKFGFDGVAGMLNAFRHGEAGSTVPTQPPVQGDQPTPAGFWLAPMEPTKAMMDAAEECSDDWPRTTWKKAWAAMRDSWLARHPAAPQVAHPQPLAASEAKDTPQ